MDNFKHIVCPHCNEVNRVPSAALGAQCTCSQCKQALFTAHPLELTEPNFMLHISRSDIPVLVDFWEPGCAPCHMMASSYVKVAQRMEPELRVTKLNTVEAPHIAEQFNIQNIPTLILFKGGCEIARKLGAHDAIIIEAWVKAKL